ncbi:MAG: hypothetical protein KatS3mg009_0027 [Acidimicrobiia bacterium]|nr:MAG: hypothetical protein KatS3mg009_0027 [Acidimicrobiia bacterium]
MTPSRRAALAPILAVVLVGVSWFWAVRAAGADEVVPVTGNRYCTETNVGGTTVRGLDTDYGERWRDVRLRELDPTRPDHTAGDGTLEVTITGFTGTGFDWSSNIPIDGVFVNAGAAPATAHRFYRYDPEATSGTGLTGADGTTPIDHISFCYDVEGDDDDGYDGPATRIEVAGNRYCTDTVVGGTTIPGLDDEHGGGARWADVRLRSLDPTRPDYTVTAGDVEVTVSGFTGTSFDWSATRPLVGVFVNAGTRPDTAHLFYRYDPPVSADSGLTAADPSVPIDHVSFCYLAAEGPSTSTTVASSTSAPTTQPGSSTTVAGATSSSTSAAQSSTSTTDVGGAGASTTTADPGGTGDGSSVLGTLATLPFTGGDTGLWLLTGSSLVAAGAFTTAALRDARRRRR